LERDTVRSLGAVTELRWYTIAQVAQMLGYGLTKTKHLVLSEQIKSVKDGGNRRILPEWVDDYVRRVVKEDAG
jgi:excisionase family DNA binding protein